MKPRILSPVEPPVDPEVVTPEQAFLRTFAAIFREYESAPTLRRRSELRQDGLRAAERYFAAKVGR